MTTMAPQIIRCRAPAKVNLTLSVVGRRRDGFHDLESWVVPIDWCDELSLTAADRLTLHVEGDSTGVPRDASNLAWRATEALAAAAGREPCVDIALHKSIPTGAGLGGGSSDAASTLLGLNRLWELKWPIDRLLPVAADIGSDVPLFLTPGNVILRGRGERIERLDRGWNGWIAVVAPPFSVSTKAVYEAWEAGENIASAQPWHEPAVETDVLLPKLYNDLEPAAFSIEPRLRELHSALEALGRPVRMTGSGGGLFTIFDHEADAEAWNTKARGRLSADYQAQVFSTAT